MARGQPDWGGKSAVDTVFRVADLGELAVRLGSVDSYERGGDVMAIETFENGLSGVSTTLVGTGAVVDLHLGAARNGLFSARLVGGSTSTGVAGITKSLPINDLSNFGVEASFALPGTVDTVLFELYIYDGTNRAYYSMRWSDTNNTIDYLNSLGAYVTIATGVSLYSLASHFHTAKLVVAGASDEFIRFRLNDTTYSLADIAARVTASTTLPLILGSVGMQSRAGFNDTIYMDDIIITQNEPG